MINISYAWTLLFNNWTRQYMLLRLYKTCVGTDYILLFNYWYVIFASFFVTNNTLLSSDALFLHFRVKRCISSESSTIAVNTYLHLIFSWTLFYHQFHRTLTERLPYIPERIHCCYCCQHYDFFWRTTLYFFFPELYRFVWK